MGFFSPSGKNTDKTPKAKEKVNKTAQQSIPYLHLYDNGIIEVSKNVFSKSYLLEDVNFKIASQPVQDDIFIKYGEFLNMFSNEIKAEITVFNRSIVQDDFFDSILMKYKHDGLDEYREEQNKILVDKMSEGKNNIIKEKYLTVTIEAKSFEDAVSTFSRIDVDVSLALKKINGAETSPMTAKERLNILFDIYNADAIGTLNRTAEIDGNTVEAFNMNEINKQGITSKSVIAPSEIVFNANNFKLGDTYGQIMFLQGWPSFLSTDFMSEINDLGCNMLTSIHYDSLRQDKAVRLVKNQLTSINSNVIDKQKRASKSGYNIDLVSPDLMQSKDETQKLLADMTSRNQKLFYVTFVIAHFAKDEETLNKQCETISSIAQKYLVFMRKLTSQQEWGLAAALPLGNNKLELKRLLNTESASLFLPFSTQELTQKSGFYYGLNAVSHNLILFDRTESKNANGLILGVPGSGKSFSAKREILNVLLNTDADVYIIDPENEYTPLAAMLGGEVIKIAAGAKTYINPMDMDMDYADDEDPVTLKSDFICSLCETILGGKYGLSVTQKSIVDRCVRQVYEPYLKYMREHPEAGTCDITKSPTLTNLYNALTRQPEPDARTIALALERFVIGSLDIFAKRTNVNIKNRFVVYNIKEIGKGLKELGLQICLNDIWNRTITNKKQGKKTWFYIDEFYLLTQTESSVIFLQEIFKRARKWGGVPTGITQNVEDMLVNKEARTIMSNCDFVLMLSQSPNDRQDLAKMYNISPSQLTYITNADSGQGLLYTGKSIVPFIDKYPRDTKSYAAMSSSVKDAAIQKKLFGVESGAD